MKCLWKAGEKVAPGGVAVECLHKEILAGIDYGIGSDGTGVLDFSKYNATAMQQESNKQYGADLSSPTSLVEIAKTAINRGIEDGLTRHARDFGNRTLDVAIQRGQVEALRGGMRLR